MNIWVWRKTQIKRKKMEIVRNYNLAEKNQVTATANLGLAQSSHHPLCAKGDTWKQGNMSSKRKNEDSNQDGQIILYHHLNDDLRSSFLSPNIAIKYW